MPNTESTHTMIPMIKIRYPEGQAPHTDSVAFHQVASHIAAQDGLATEARVLLAFSESEDVPQVITVPGSKWELVMDFCGAADYARVQ
jgi:hypothetical protein